MGASWQEPRQAKSAPAQFAIFQSKSVKLYQGNPQTSRTIYLHLEVNTIKTVASFLFKGEASPGSFPRASFPSLTQTFLLKINTTGVRIKLNSMLPYMDIHVILFWSTFSLIHYWPFIANEADLKGRKSCWRHQSRGRGVPAAKSSLSSLLIWAAQELHQES